MNPYEKQSMTSKQSVIIFTVIILVCLLADNF